MGTPRYCSESASGCAALPVDLSRKSDRAGSGGIRNFDGLTAPDSPQTMKRVPHRPGQAASRGFAALTIAFAVIALEGQVVLAASLVSYQESPISMVSSCPGQNAEVEQAVDMSRGYGYDVWMGCQGIGSARTSDGGLHFGE